MMGFQDQQSKRVYIDGHTGPNWAPIGYGKTMENLRKRISVKLVNNEKHYLKHVSKPTYVSRRIFDKHSPAIHETKRVLTLNKPIYVGFTVFELSKWLLFIM